MQEGVQLACKAKVHVKRLERSARRAALAFEKERHRGRRSEVSQPGCMDSGNDYRGKKRALGDRSRG